MEEDISVVIGGLVSHVRSLQINTTVRHKNWMFKNKKFYGYKFANQYLTRLWYLFTFALLNPCIILQPKGIWDGGSGRGGGGGDGFVLLHHCPVWRRGPQFFLFILMNYYVALNVFANTDSVVLLLIPMPFCGDWQRYSYRVIPHWPRIPVILQSVI